MSKGSARRPSQVPREKYADSHDRIFGDLPGVTIFEEVSTFSREQMEATIAAAEKRRGQPLRGIIDG